MNLYFDSFFDGRNVNEILNGRRYFMNDWNGNGKYDVQDSWMDYQMANSHSSSGSSSDWWIWVILAIVVCVCPPIGILIMIIAFLVK